MLSQTCWSRLPPPPLTPPQKAVLFANDTTVSRGMVKYACGIPKESIVDVEGVVAVPSSPVESCSQKDVSRGKLEGWRLVWALGRSFRALGSPFRAFDRSLRVFDREGLGPGAAACSRGGERTLQHRVRVVHVRGRSRDTAH